MRRLALTAVLLAGCGLPMPTQSNAATPTQAFIIERARTFEQQLGIGQFIIVFGKTVRTGSAAETGCPQKGPPWGVVFNSEWIESDRAQAMGEPYFEELLAHEMCHSWLEKTKKQCPSSEDEANVCGHSLVTTGSPK